MRNLTKTLAAVTLMVPLGAHPLGIGDIELHSALNQQLNAEILLNLSASENLADVRVKLAPPEKFQEVGIPRSYFLSKIKFKPIVKPDGKVVIQLKSRGVVKEPFLDFLLEVSWPKGSLYREFSVLVDPPVTYQKKAAPRITAPTQQSASTTRAPGSARTNDRTTASQTTQAQNFQGVDQYKVRQNDTLWQIAQRVKTQDASVEQMMIALFEANPQAFYRQNVNTLMGGKTLTVPEESVVLKLSRNEASSEFSRQTKIWKGEIVPPVTPQQESTAATAGPGNRITLVAPSDVDVTGQERLTPEQTGRDQAAHSGSSADSQTSGQDKQVNDRLAKLEQQLLTMQKMLALRDEQLAELQNELAEQQPGEAAKQPTISPQPVKPEVLSKPPKIEVPEQKPEPVVETPPPKPVKPLAPVQPSVQKKAPVVQPKPAVGSAENRDDSLYYMIFGSVGLTLLGLLGWLLWRRKMFADEDGTESIFAASSEIILPEDDQELTIPVIDDESTYDVGTVGESSFLSEFIPSDFDAFDTEQAEVDPISEADVYLAYGRYQQAEELMRQAIEDHPDRDECKLKLLDIFYANEDADAYTQYASELADSGKREEVVFWAKVAEMGKEIAPDAAIFSSSAEVNNAQSDFEQAPEEHTSIESVNVDDTGLDFDLGSLGESESQETGEDEDISGSLDSIEQLDDSLELDLGETSTAHDQPEPEAEQDDFFNAEELDLGLELEEDEVQSGTDDIAEQQKTDTDALDGFDFSADSLVQESSVEDKPLDNGLDFSLDLDKLGSEGEADSSESEPLYDLNDMDEFDTKIDLAKAYIDMGDPEAAKAIVDEVLQKGSTEQQQEAQMLLDTML